MPSARHKLYLAYGSNLHPHRLEERVGRVELLGNIALSGWSLRFDKRGSDGSAKANLHAAVGQSCNAFAAVYRLDSRQVLILDGFEGCGWGYETFPMTVSIRGNAVDGFTYLAPSQWITPAMVPFDWYLRLVLEGARFHGFPERYIDEITNQTARRDPDAGRARAALDTLNLSIPAHYER
ncbi:MAG: gamma-glutamylcyclotransferase family protein [Xanthomonadales bacterium]|nr:gamma-glutamylcyclotransferase family protein [Xanthomonadales bacterium]